MGFNKRQHLEQNITALRVAFKLEEEKRTATAAERLLLNQYRGFGGLKFILNPVKNPEDINQWRKSEQSFFSLTQELHHLLQEKATDEKQYRRFVGSMRSSVLSAFYTPPAIIEAISSVLKAHQLDTHKFLDPSAGIGSFLSSFSALKKENNTAYEKDLLTGKILKQLYPQADILIKGFEEIPEKEQNSYDIVASNIPFGDTSVFDLSYSRSNNPAKIQAARSIHNYFFLKGTDMLREGGLLAFITSQGVLNSPKNEPIRRALMQNNHLISAVHLPNNLFADYAGTEIGSDLIVLQKDTRKQELSPQEELFCQSMLTESNAPNNALFMDTTRIVHTDKKMATDPYGKPALIYTHKEGIEGIAKSLKQMLWEDFDQTLNLELYEGKSSKEAIPQTSNSINGISVAPPIQNSNQKISPSTIKKGHSPEDKQLSIFNLFEASTSVTPPKKRTRNRRQNSRKRKRVINRQMNLFNADVSPLKTVSTSRKISNTTSQPNRKRQEIVGDLFSRINSEVDVSKPAAPRIKPDPAPYGKELQAFHRNNCLVTDKGWVGHLQEVDKEENRAIFHPLELLPSQKARAEAYITLRDTYLDLYQKEADTQTEHQQERQNLNRLYDTYVKKYGYLNNAANNKLIKTDSAGKEIPYLERSVGGVVHKADIFNRPVSFSTTTLATDNPEEALAASLNKYGGVNLAYMADISSMSIDSLKVALQNRIYYNPLQQEYEISERWISEKVADHGFIHQRSPWAAQAYEEAFLAGNTIDQCNRIAENILFQNLQFSKFDTVFLVVRNEFDTLMVDEELRSFALKLSPSVIFE